MKKPPPPPPIKRPVQPIKRKPSGKPGKMVVSFRAEHQEAIFRAMMIYIRTKGASLRDVWETGRIYDGDPDSPLIKDFISFDGLRQQAHKAKWVDQRTEFWKGVHTEVLATARTEVIQDQLNELGNLHGVRALAMANIEGVYEVDPLTGERKLILAPIKPKSLEGLINAFVRLDNHLNKRRDAVLTQTVQGLPANEAPTKERVIPQIEDNMTDDEIEALTRDIMRKRAGLPAEDATPDPAEATEEPPGEE